jgi:hypothetical protein
MNIDIAHMGPILWIAAAILLVVLAVVIIRFFWQHILKYLWHGCLTLVGIIILLLILHYLKVF